MSAVNVFFGYTSAQIVLSFVFLGIMECGK